MEHFTKWDERQEQELRRLFYLVEDGAFLSHTLIGRRMEPPVSRNAAINKLRRMNLERDPSTPCKGVDGRIVDPTKQEKKEITVPRVPATYGRTRISAVSARVSTPPVRERLYEPSPYAIQILEATNRTCKFPIGHVGHEGFHLCGAHTDKAPYCAEHRAICYIPLKERRDSVPAYFARYKAP